MTQIVAVKTSPQRLSTAVQQKRTVVIQQSSLPPSPVLARTVVVREPYKRITVIARQRQRVVVALPGAQGRPGPPGPPGQPGPPGPPSIYVSDTPPPDPVLNTLWLDTS